MKQKEDDRDSEQIIQTEMKILHSLYETSMQILILCRLLRFLSVEVQTVPPQLPPGAVAVMKVDNC